MARPLAEIKIQRDRAFHPRRCASPAFLLNTVSLILRLAAPLWTKGLSSKVDWRYALRHERVSFKEEAPLFSGDGAATVDEESDEDDDEDARMLRQALKMSMGQAAPLGFFPSDVEEFHFITEIFFLAHRAISSCLLPLWSEMTEQVHLLYDLSGPRGQKLDEPSQRRINLHGDGWACALEDPRLLEDAGAFATFAVEWLLDQLKAPDARERASKLPAALVKDACDLWTHLARAGARTGNAQARMGAGATFGPSEASRAVLACCELMRSPLVESPIVQVLMRRLMYVFIYSTWRGDGVRLMATSTSRHRRCIYIFFITGQARQLHQGADPASTSLAAQEGEGHAGRCVGQ